MKLVVPRYDGDINEHLPMPVGFHANERHLHLEPLDFVVEDPVELNPLSRSKLIISFGGSGYDEDGEAMYSFAKFLAHYGGHRMYLRDQFGAWYFNGVRGISTDISSTAAFLRYYVDVHRSRNPNSFVWCTGVSAGGFAAILFGLLLGVDRVVAINPQTLLQPGVECFAHGNLYKLKWTNPDELAWRDLLNLPASETDVQIVYGEDERVDRFHSGRMAVRPDVRLFPVPGTHSTTGTILRDNDGLGTFFGDAFFDYEEDPHPASAAADRIEPDSRRTQ